MEIFSARRVVKTEINGNLQVQYLVNTANKLELPSQAVTVFAWSANKLEVLRYPDGS